jgi:hypothetical protein
VTAGIVSYGERIVASMGEGNRIAAKEETMRRTQHARTGWLTPREAERMAAALPQHRDVIRLLTDEPVRASASYGDDGDDELTDEIKLLYPPGTFGPQEARRLAAKAERIAASARRDRDALAEDDLGGLTREEWDRLFPPEPAQ